MTIDSSQFPIVRLLEQNKGSVKRNTKNGVYMISSTKNIDSYKSDSICILFFITDASFEMRIIGNGVIVG